eukprot:630870-Rhodomonas_salina.2
MLVPGPAQGDPLQVERLCNHHDGMTSALYVCLPSDRDHSATMVVPVGIPSTASKRERYPGHPPGVGVVSGKSRCDKW